ncbi:MAG: hypothetical protein ACI4D7_04825 [Lachnospiraceae bacterium]
MSKITGLEMMTFEYEDDTYGKKYCRNHRNYGIDLWRKHASR